MTEGAQRALARPFGFDARALTGRFGTPLWVLDGATIRANVAAIRAALEESRGFRVHYAAKANPLVGVLALVSRLGLGVEIASQGELIAALRAGVDPKRILFAGPAKSDADLDAAVRAGVGSIHVESIQEAHRLSRIAIAAGRVQRFGIRVTLPRATTESRSIIGGPAATKFGVDPDEALARATELALLAGLRLVAVHNFQASNVLAAGELVAHAGRVLRFAREFFDRLGREPDYVDVGGGLGVTYSPDEAGLDLAALAEGLLGARSAAGFGDAVLLTLEPGRAVVASAGVYLCTVIATKRVAGVDYLLVDGGIHGLLRPALIGSAHPIARADSDAPATRRYTIAGPLCTGLDVLGREVALPETGPGDLLAIGRAGAYGATESMPWFLSHPAPAEVLLLDGEAHVLRRRQEPEAWLAIQELPRELRAGPGG